VVNQFKKNSHIANYNYFFRHLQDELKQLEEKGVPEDEEESCGRVCRRCRSPLGVVFNSGALCVSCSKVVCKDCRIPTEAEATSWICTVCGKIRCVNY